VSIIMMWLEGYCTDENEGAVIDFGKMAGDTAHPFVYCGDHPDDDIITAAEEVLGTKERWLRGPWLSHAPS